MYTKKDLFDFTSKSFSHKETIGGNKYIMVAADNNDGFFNNLESSITMSFWPNSPMFSNPNRFSSPNHT